MIDYTAMAEQLHGEYRTIFEKAELYSDMNGIQEEIKADRLMNLLDLLMTAEADQKPAAEIIRSDIGTFCKDYFSDYDMHHKISTIAEEIYDLARVLLLILLLDIFFPEHPAGNLISMKSDILPVIAGMLTGILLRGVSRYLIGPIIYRSQKIPAIVYYILVLVAFIISIAFIFNISTDIQLQVPLFPLLAASVSYIVIYLTVRSIIRYRKTGSIRKPKLMDSEFEFHLTNPISPTDMENAVQEALLIRYRRINKKRNRKNQPAMTTQEFIDRIRKENTFVNTICIRGLGITYIAMGIGSLINEIHSYGIRFHSFIFPAILSAIYIPLFLFIRYCILHGNRHRENILTAWETEGTDLSVEKKSNTPDPPENLQN